MVGLRELKGQLQGSAKGLRFFKKYARMRFCFWHNKKIDFGTLYAP
ncbi:hypothetical protein BN341_18450 [Helicobacter heilmannii ASB1.4]|uniref:Uncharacterized protein n=1 Tax=Helicobacter heilmannii TaxID=35817 RepID=A0A0K2Y6H3_HELHE|nr:hypothetical protein BN341_18450 [Helicobacter heilmannii ASB1.4]CRI33692.1 hypothetical protein HHE01_08960 [Helicobacter heilmannii]